MREERGENPPKKPRSSKKVSGERKKRTAASMSAASAALVFVECGVESGLSTSHITSTSCPPRTGSG